MHITESYPVVPFVRVIVRYQRSNEFHFFGAMDGDQVCVQRLAVALSLDPGEDMANKRHNNSSDRLFFDQSYELPQYGSRRKLISPAGLYDEYGEVVVDDDGSFYYSPQDSETEYGSRTRRVKLVMDREYETSSTGEESAPEPQRTNRLASSVKSHANNNGSVYVAQNGSIVRTRRAGSGVAPVQAPVQALTAPTNNNLLSSPVLSSRLAKHFRKLEKMAATLEERIPLNNHIIAAAAAEEEEVSDEGRSGSRGPNSEMAAPATATASFSKDEEKTLNVGPSHVSPGSTGSGHAAGAVSRATLVAAAQSSTENIPEASREREGEGGEETAGSEEEGEEREEREERESEVDIGTATARELTECLSDRTQSDEEELWMGPWNNLHIPMTKL
ncbi:unnamed protein product [Boreogadus saida]